jgi:peptidoglycan/xylan/chitin deacetylase (PgdA/CDA1 family)
MNVLPLEQNLELVELMREGLTNGQLDVTLHGYHHWRVKGLPEFIGGSDLAKKAFEGKKYLDDLLGVNIKTFVPPNNGISRIGLDAIIDAGMNLAGTPRLWSPKARRVTPRSLANYPRVWWHQHALGKHYPFIIDLGDHEEVSCHTVGPRSNFDDLCKKLEYCHQSDGIFVLATHYPAFEKKTQDNHAIGDAVYHLVDTAAALPRIEFAKFNSIWKGRQQ